jgi:hypothetical protein
MEKLSRKLQQLNWYPFETLASSNAFLWSFFANFILLELILLWTHFSNFNLRGDLIGWEIATTQVFGFAMSMVNLVRYKRFMKRYSERNDITKDEKNEMDERSSAVGFIWYWIVGTTVACFAIVPPFMVCRLLF